MFETLSNKSELVKSEKVTVLSHAPYSPDLDLFDFFLVPNLNKSTVTHFKYFIQHSGGFFSNFKNFLAMYI